MGPRLILPDAMPSFNWWRLGTDPDTRGSEYDEDDEETEEEEEE